MDDSVAVEEVDPREDLPHDVLDPVRGETGGRAALNVQVQVLNLVSLVFIMFKEMMMKIDCCYLVDVLKDKVENHLSVHPLTVADVKKPLN